MILLIALNTYFFEINAAQLFAFLRLIFQKIVNLGKRQ
jgi:hypothetical protein